MIKKKKGNDYISSSITLASAQICQSLGWHSVHKSTINILNDVLDRYLLLVTQTSVKYAHKCGRTVPTLDDVALAFDQLGIELHELEDYVQQVEACPLTTPVPPLLPHPGSTDQLHFDGDSQFPPLVKTELPTDESNIQESVDSTETDSSTKQAAKDQIAEISFEEGYTSHSTEPIFEFDSEHVIDTTRPGLKVITPKGYTPLISQPRVPTPPPPVKVEPPPEIKVEELPPPVIEYKRDPINDTDFDVPMEDEVEVKVEEEISPPEQFPPTLLSDSLSATVVVDDICKPHTLTNSLGIKKTNYAKDRKSPGKFPKKSSSDSLFKEPSSSKKNKEPKVKSPTKSTSKSLNLAASKKLTLDLSNISSLGSQKPSVKRTTITPGGTMSIKDMLIKKEPKDSPPQLTLSPQVVLPSPKIVKPINRMSPMIASPAAIIRGEASTADTPTRKIVFPEDVKPDITIDSPSSPIKSPPPPFADDTLPLSSEEPESQVLFSPVPMEMPILMKASEEEVEVNVTASDHEIDILSVSQDEITFEPQPPIVVPLQPLAGEEKRKKKKKKSDKDKERSEHRKEKKEKRKKREEKNEVHVPIPKLKLKMGSETISETAVPANILSEPEEEISPVSPLPPPHTSTPPPPLPTPKHHEPTKKEKKKKPKEVATKLTSAKLTSGFYAETITNNTSTSIAATDQVYYCPGCSKPDDGSLMIGCDSCDGWYHWVCVDITVEPAEDSQWFCPKCVPGPKKKKKKKKRE